MIADSFNIFRLIIEDKLEEQLLEEANTKFGCRGLDSIIRTLALKAYSKAITDKNQLDALIISLLDKNIFEYKWVSYSDIVPEDKHEFLQMAFKTLIATKPNLIQEEDPWYDETEDNMDNIIKPDNSLENVVDIHRIIKEAMKDDEEKSNEDPFN